LKNLHVSFAIQGRHSSLLSVPKDIKVVVPTEHTGNQKLSRVLLSCDELTLAVVLDTKVLFFDVRSVAANVRVNVFGAYLINVLGQKTIQSRNFTCWH
jgi:hypothetical protein